MITKRTLLIGGIVLLNLGGAFDSDAAMRFNEARLTIVYEDGSKVHFTTRVPGALDQLGSFMDAAYQGGAYSDWFDHPGLKHMSLFVNEGARGFLEAYCDYFDHEHVTCPTEPGTKETCNFLLDVANMCCDMPEHGPHVVRALPVLRDLKERLDGSFDEYCVGGLSFSQALMRIYGIACLAFNMERLFYIINSLMSKKPAFEVGEEHNLLQPLIDTLRACDSRYECRTCRG
jgi:hypothetical protein